MILPRNLVMLLLLFKSIVLSYGKKPTFSRIKFNTSIDDEDPDQLRSADPFVSQMQFYEERLQAGLEKLMGTGDSSLYGLFQRYNISYECKGSFALLLNSLVEYEEWAIKMIDSSSKIPEGVMYGTINSFGQYDECLDIVVYDTPEDTTSNVQLKGQYCAFDIQPRRPLSFDPNYLASELPKAKIFRKMANMATPAELSIALQIARNRFGYCLPSTCHGEDVKSLAQVLNDQFHTNMSVAWCETKEQLQRMDPVQLAIITLLSALVMTSLIISYFHYSEPTCLSDKLSKDSVLKKCINCFAIANSYNRFVSQAKLDDRFSFIYGIRFLTHLWVMYAHTYAIQNFMSVGNTVKLRKIPQEFLFQIFINGTLAAETFFFMSGFVVAIFMCRNLVESSIKSFTHGTADDSEVTNNKFTFITRRRQIETFIKNWLRYIFKLYAIRIWRETPIVLIVILIAILWPAAGSGPIWTETISFFSNNCRKYWMSTLLLYSNYKQPEEMCLLHSWYLSLDFQLYLIAPFVIYLLLKKTRYGVTVALTIIIIGIVGTCSETVINNYPPVPIFSIQSVDYVRIVKDWVYKLFFRPMIHLPSYIIGILTAYYIYHRKIQLVSIAIVSGTVVSTVIKFTILFAVYPWNKGESVPSVTISSAYAGFSRPLWSLSLALDVLCGTSSGSGLLTTLLSWSFFRPLARLTFVAYLMHPLVMMATAATNRAPYAFTHFLMFQRFSSFVLMSYTLAFFIHLIIERPLIEIEKTFFNLSCNSSSSMVINHGHVTPSSMCKRSRPVTSTNEMGDSKYDNCNKNSIDEMISSVKLTSMQSIVTHNSLECNIQLTPINSTDGKRC